MMKEYDGLLVSAPPTATICADILRRQAAKRCGPYVVYHLTEERRPLNVHLELSPSLGTETFQIAQAAPDALQIAGGDGRGLLYGIGKFLRDATCRTGWLAPGSWRGTSAPKRPLRGIYFASHGGNWFENAPMELVEEYVTEIALWGVNAIMFWYCMHDFDSPEAPASLRMVERLKRLARHAQRLGLGIHSLGMGNEGYASTPDALRAERAVQNGYVARPVAWFDGQICPAKPGGRELILANRRAMLDLFADVPFDGFTLWPYDQGGCTCAACAPWGANGFLRLGPDVTNMVRQRHPRVRCILSAWEFDKFAPGEYEGLARAFAAGKPDWADYLLAEDHCGRAPAWLLKRGVPGGLPYIGFPEISMWKTEPWGGYGAICQPEKLQAMWNQVRHLSSGGFPYSEGPFEDINKAICARFYWDDQPAHETVREYARHELGSEEAVEAITLIERSFPRCIEGRSLPIAYRIEDPAAAEAAWAAVQRAEPLLPAWARRSWRWRLIHLRARIDFELVRSNFHVSETAEDALNELTEMYCFTADSNYCMDPQRIVRHGKPRTPVKDASCPSTLI